MKCLFAVTMILGLMTNVSASNYQEVEFDTIQVEGQYSQPRLTAAQKRKLLRKKLEKQNEQMVQKKIEEARLRNELALMKKMQEVFNQQMKALEALQ